MIVKWRGGPVPWTASWSSEFPYFVDRCPYGKMPAIRQPQSQGQGVPRFKNPNFDRQRKAMILGLCDLCAKPLKGRTKVSLSALRQIDGGVDATGLFQLEPLLHRECAEISAQNCPELRRLVSSGMIPVRQVSKYAVRLSVMLPEAVAEQIPDYAGPQTGIIGYAQIKLEQWIDRDAAWLSALAAAA